MNAFSQKLDCKTGVKNTGYEYWNKELVVEAEQQISAFHKLPESINLDEIFCIKEFRVANGNTTVSIDGKYYRFKGYDGSSLKGNRIQIITTQSLKTFALIHKQRYLLEEVKVAIKSKSSCMDGCAKSSSVASSKELASKTQRNTPSKPSTTPINPVITHMGDKPLNPPVGDKINDNYVSVLNLKEIRPKRYWTKSLKS